MPLYVWLSVCQSGPALPQPLFTPLVGNWFRWRWRGPHARTGYFYKTGETKSIWKADRDYLCYFLECPSGLFLKDQPNKQPGSNRNEEGSESENSNVQWNCGYPKQEKAHGLIEGILCYSSHPPFVPYHTGPVFGFLAVFVIAEHAPLQKVCDIRESPRTGRHQALQYTSLGVVNLLSSVTRTHLSIIYWRKLKPIAINHVASF